MATLGETLSTATYREILTATRTYYVRTDGNDSNTGLTNTAGGAFLTIQKAVNTLATLDSNGFNVTVRVADGTYLTNAVTLKDMIGTGTVIINGNTTTPANVIIDGGFYKAVNNTHYTIQGFKFNITSSTFTTAFQNDGTATIFVSSFILGTGYSAHFSASGGGVIYIAGSYTILGGATYHCIAGFSSFIKAASITVTLTGTPAITYFCYSTRLGAISMEAITYSGSATGQRYYIDTNSIIYTGGGGANYFPGNVAGATATGGQYV